MVSLSSRNSPRTSTVIFLVKSPLATAVVTLETSRNCTVRLVAIKFTLSVRSFHVPATPLTLAWPPSLPSVPTSRATRVTSEEKDESWSTIVLTVFAVRENSPSSLRPPISVAIVCERSPLATAPITRAVSLIGCTRQPMSVFTESTRSCHAPEVLAVDNRSVIFPSLPTTRLMRFSSSVDCSIDSATSLKVSAILPAVPVHSTGSRTEKSPFFNAMSARNISPEPICAPSTLAPLAWAAFVLALEWPLA